MAEVDTAGSRYLKVARSIRSYAFGTLAVIGFGTVATVAGAIWMRHRSLKRLMKLPEEFVLELDLESNVLRERTQPTGLEFLQGGSKQLELRRLVRALDAAKDDTRVKGLVMYVGSRESIQGVAQVQELRAAIERFRKAAGLRAPTVAFSTSFGDTSPTPYYMATAMEKVYVQPVGSVSPGGFEVVVPFLRGLLDKVGVRPLFYTREEYKNAAAMFVEKGFSDAHREATVALLGSMDEQVLEGVATARGLEQAAVKEAFGSSPHSAEAATKLGLIDGVKFRDEVQDMSRQAGEGKKALTAISLQRYIVAMDGQEQKQQAAARRAALMAAMRSDDPSEAAMDKAWPGKAHVALVHAVGPIVEGGSPASPPMANREQIESSKLVKVLQRLRNSKDVKAVVLRVNSPGGSAVASNSIHRELQRLRDAGKAVVVSMGDVAASGGYYIAAPANRIIAQPGTITGSIGVVVGKFNARGLAESAGVNPQTIATWPNSGLWSPFEDLTPEQDAKAQQLMDEVYHDFMGKVAAGRGMSSEAVRAVAKGRVWTGQQALQAGLVDELGGLDRAVAVARQAAGLPDDEKQAPLVEYSASPLPPLLRVLRGFQSGTLQEAGGLAGLVQAFLPSLGHSGAGAGAAAAAAAATAAVDSTATVLQSAAGDLKAAVGAAGPQMILFGAEALAGL